MHGRLTLAVVCFGFLLTEGVSFAIDKYGYKAVAGEVFIMQCADPNQSYLFNLSKRTEDTVVWFKTDCHATEKLPGQDGTIVKKGNFLNFTVVEERHAGHYCCDNGRERLTFVLDVMPMNRTHCRANGDREVILVAGRGGQIQCPGVQCYTKASRVHRWYKDRISLSKLNRYLEIEGTELLLKTLYAEDNAMFTCDASYMDGRMWTMRRSVKVTVIPEERHLLPRILHPIGDDIVDADLGKNMTLTCRVQFSFERKFHPVVRWFVNYGDEGEDVPLKSETGPVVESFAEQTITQNAHLHQVTQRHLGGTFTCFAQNSKGNVTSTMRLRRRFTGGGLLLVITGPLVGLFIVAGVTVLVHVYWVEIFLLYRMHLPFPHTIAVGKEYDAFVSYMSGSSSEEEEDGDLTGSLLGICHLPRVLEQQWGYRLFLLERDLIPGGVYTEEVVKSIQRSRMIICLLSSLYLRSPCVFELETGLKTLKEDPQFRIVLVWIGKPPKHLGSLALPGLVRRALHVLPAIRCTAGSLSRCDSKFWKSLRLKLPQTKVCESSS